MEKAIVVFQPDNVITEVELGTSLLEAAKKAGIKIESLCGGKGTCGKCKLIVDSGAENLDGPTYEELSAIKNGKFSQKLLDSGYRFACSVKVKNNKKFFSDSSIGGHVILTVPAESRLGAQKILVEGFEKRVRADPLVNKYFVEMPKPSLAKATPDLERATSTLKGLGLGDLEIIHDALKKLPDSLRTRDWKSTFVIWDDREIISIEPGDTVKRKFGLAVDIGTTTIVGYLVDLNNGKLIGIGSILNPQISLGEDVITRITYCIQNAKGLDKINKVIVDGLNEVIEEACSKAKVKKDEIYEVTVVGNTAMHHLFLKLNPKFLALSPFTPVLKRGLDIKACNLGIKVNPGANVHILPVIAGFVGADTVGVLLSTNIYKEPELTLATDIGTNGEIMLGNKDAMEVCSAAAGPAFEGAHLKQGMRGEPGAIEKISIDANTLDVNYGTIDDLPPRGICGSGIVDAIAEMFLAGVLTRTGNINADIKNQRIRRTKNVLEFVLAWADETAKGVGDLAITQGDVREIQLAKAAIYAGAKIMMKRRHAEEKDIERVYLAGAFGNYIDKVNAKIIGLYPDVPGDKVKSVGNAAGMGAKHALISRGKREEAEIIAKRTNYLELTIAPQFKDEFIAAMYLPHSKIERFPSLRKTCEKLPSWSELLKN